MHHKYHDIRTCLAIGLAALGLTLSGCAFGTREALLQYPPEGEISAVPEAQAAPDIIPKKIEILLVAFNDERDNKRLVGTVRNGFGMRTADVIAKNNVQTWVFEAAKKELHDAGYVVITKRDASQSQATLSGDITRVFCDAYLTYEGEVSLHVKLMEKGKDILDRTYAGKGSAGINLAMTSNAYAQSLELALSDALKRMVSDMNTSLQH